MEKSFYSQDRAFQFIVSSDVLDFWKETIGSQIIVVGLKKSGCSGYAYTFEIEQCLNQDQQEAFYTLDLGQTTTLAVDQKIAKEIFRVLRCESLPEHGGFSVKWTHETAKFFCGCGESFSIEE